MPTASVLKADREVVKCKIKLLFKKFRIPVGHVGGVEKRHPLFIPRHTKSFLHERCPLRFEWLPYKGHARLMWRSAALAAVAFMAGADDVFPHRGASLRAGNHVVKVEFVAR